MKGKQHNYNYEVDGLQPIKIKFWVGPDVLKAFESTEGFRHFGCVNVTDLVDDPDLAVVRDAVFPQTKPQSRGKGCEAKMNSQKPTYRTHIPNVRIKPLEFKPDNRSFLEEEFPILYIPIYLLFALWRKIWRKDDR